MPPLLYLAHPYSTTPGVGKAANYNSATKVGIKLRKMGYFVLSPVNNSHGCDTFMDGSRIPDKHFYEEGLELMTRCDALVMGPGWTESKGCNLELSYWVDILRRPMARVFMWPSVPDLKPSENIGETEVI